MWAMGGECSSVLDWNSGGGNPLPSFIEIPVERLLLEADLRPLPGL